MIWTLFFVALLWPCFFPPRKNRRARQAGAWALLGGAFAVLGSLIGLGEAGRRNG